ncbi:MAG TPA: cation:dicarboxylase symporter family transporter [Pyrinomonadaceae bacterium]|jgi:proton glutamate symport protein
MKRPSLTVQSLLALVLGLALGIAGHKWAVPGFEKLAIAAKALGGLWVAALQLTVLPLVITHLLAAISGSGARSIGKLGIRAVVLFLGLLIAAGLFAAFLTPPLVAQISVDDRAVSSLSTAASANVAGSSVAKTNSESTSVADWISTLLPTNLLEAGIRGDIFPLLLFTAFFGVAVTRLPEDRYKLLTEIFQGLAEAMMQLIGWLLVVTPFGVFALTFTLALKTGGSVGGVLGAYIVIVSALMLLFALLLYPFTAFAAKTKIIDFARGVAPAQMVAASTRSSIAALPALVEGGSHHLRLPRTGTGFVLPLSVSLFKVNRPISGIVKLVLVAHLYGIQLRPTTIAIFLATTIIVSFGTAGIPQSGPGFKTLPAYVAAGVPIEAVLVVEAVESIPDIFKTVLNVTGQMSVATVLTRSYRTVPGEMSASTPAEGVL